MKTKTIIPLAIIAMLPFGAVAENISGAMYTAPLHETNLTPAPTTNAYAPYGRINIDTDDQEHIATTAYVKGAYNSSIAAVNKIETELGSAIGDAMRHLDDLHNDIQENYQEKIMVPTTVNGGTAHPISDTAAGMDELMGAVVGGQDPRGAGAYNLVTGQAVAYAMLSQRVPIYTTWGDDSDNATTGVTLMYDTSGIPYTNINGNNN